MPPERAVAPREAGGACARVHPHLLRALQARVEVEGCDGQPALSEHVERHPPVLLPHHLSVRCVRLNVPRAGTGEPRS